jgi:hypothetical protein
MQFDAIVNILFIFLFLCKIIFFLFFFSYSSFLFLFSSILLLFFSFSFFSYSSFLFLFSPILLLFFFFSYFLVLSTSFFQAREAQKRANFLSQETDRWTKDKSNLLRTLSDGKIEMKGNNDFISKMFLSDARGWMDGLKKRIAKGGEVFRGTYSTLQYSRI